VSDEQSASKAGRGALLLALGNVYFIFAGFALQFGLPAVLSRTMFGAYTQVNYIASLFNNVLVSGTQQAVSHFTAQTPGAARSVQAAGLRMHLVLGLGIAVAFIAGAPVVAWLLHDSSKTAPLMLAGLIIGGYAFYAVFIGTANGLHRFGVQAMLSVIFATIRAVAMIGMAVVGAGVIGVIGGWVACVGVIMVIAIIWVGTPGKAERLAVGPIAKFFIGIAIYLVLFNALMFVDTLILKRLMAEHYASHLPAYNDALARVLPWAANTAGYHVDPAALADLDVGYYAAVQNLARLSYQVLLAATFVAFPLVSKSTFDNDRDTTRRYIMVAVRYSLIGGALMAVVMAANPKDILGLVYASDFADKGAAALPLLALGNVAFSIIAIAGTIFNAAKRTRAASLLAALTLIVAMVANYIAIPIAADGGDPIFVTAAITGGAMVLGAIAYGTALFKVYGGFLPLLSMIRVALAVAVAMVVGHVLPLHGKLMTLVEAGVVAGVYVVVLVATRELGAGDLAAIRAVRAKR